MTPRCTELDLFFDGELETDQAAAFRDHLATCERCQRVLLGRMQEAVAADTSAEEAANALDDAVAAAQVEGSAAADHAVAPDAIVDTAGTDADLVASAHAPRAAEVTTGPDEPVAIAEAPVPIDEARRATRRRRVLLYTAPVIAAAAAAAALPLFCFRGHEGSQLTLEFPLPHGSTRTRGVAHVGESLLPTVRGERHRAIAVFFERHLHAACPGDSECSDADGKLELRITLKEPGLYTVVALGSDDEIPRPAPGKTLDEILVQCASIRCERRTIQADD